MHYFRYNKADNKLYCFADDVHPRYVTAMTLLDYDSVAAADKFGNLFVLRLPADVSAQVRAVAALPGAALAGRQRETRQRQGMQTAAWASCLAGLPRAPSAARRARTACTQCKDSA